MKSFYFLIAFIFIRTTSSYAQYYQIDIGVHDQRPCEFESTTSVDVYSKVRMYSTLSDEWYGEVDSSLCYSLVNIGGNWRFPLANVPLGRSVFFEMQLDSSLALDTSAIYLIYPLTANTNLHLGTEMPDSAGSGVVQRSQTVIMDNGGAICFATQKVEGQKINRMIFEYESLGLTTDYFLNDPELQPQWGDGTHIIPQLTQQQTVYGANLVRYWHEIYPTADSISYTDVAPVGNPTDSTLVEFYVEYFSSLHFQDYTAMRGALVEGSDSVRHGLEIYLEGEMCITGAEVIWEGGTQLVIDGGTIGFNGTTGCNQFGKGGGLRVKRGTQFRYGNDGVGMLALKTGAQIRIDSLAELIIDGPVFMYEYYMDPEPQQLFMNLPAGARLTFAAGATLSNQYSLDGLMELNVMMLGGTVDLSGLSLEEQNLINLIYPDAINEHQKSQANLSIHPNPVSNTRLQFVLKSPIRSGREITCEIFDISGKLLQAQRLIPESGNSQFDVAIDNLSSGLYNLRLLDGQGVVLARGKFVRN